MVFANGLSPAGFDAAKLANPPDLANALNPPVEAADPEAKALKPCPGVEGWPKVGPELCNPAKPGLPNCGVRFPSELGVPKAGAAEPRGVGDPNVGPPPSGDGDPNVGWRFEPNAEGVPNDGVADGFPNGDGAPKAGWPNAGC